MLNRLMFIYFLQKKGFLDGDEHYLRNRLKQVQARKGKGKFQTFYRVFLLALFHEGFSKQPKQRKLEKDLTDRQALVDSSYQKGKDLAAQGRWLELARRLRAANQRR